MQRRLAAQQMLCALSTTLLAPLPAAAQAGAIGAWIARRLIPSIAMQGTSAARVAVAATATTATATAQAAPRAVGSAMLRDAAGRMIATSVPAATTVARSERLAGVLKHVTVTGLASVATDAVLQRVNQAPDDSVVRWTVAYYAVLAQGDAEAAKGMWIDPPDKDFRHIRPGGARYEIRQLNERAHAASDKRVVVFRVLATDDRARSTEYDLQLTWMLTEFGWRIREMRRAA